MSSNSAGEETWRERERERAFLVETTTYAKVLGEKELSKEKATWSECSDMRPVVQLLYIWTEIRDIRD